MPLNPLQIREIFHLTFLQAFLRRFDPKLVALKGGVNLRLFFGSRRHSEDMDLDVDKASVDSLQTQVLKTLAGIAPPMRTHGIIKIAPPSMKSAKQTETTQRFKVHLETEDGLDLFTKIEFSRRGFSGETKFDRVNGELLRQYRLSPLIMQHYTACSAFDQKIDALLGRTAVQARDLFDLHHLLSFLPRDYSPSSDAKTLAEARERVEEISYEQYRDTVVAYLSQEDQLALGSQEDWQTIRKDVLDIFPSRGGKK